MEDEPPPDPASEARARRFVWDHPGWTATHLPDAEPGWQWVADRHQQLTHAEHARGGVVTVYAATADELDAAVDLEQTRANSASNAEPAQHAVRPRSSPHASPN